MIEVVFMLLVPVACAGVMGTIYRKAKNQQRRQAEALDSIESEEGVEHIIPCLDRNCPACFPEENT